MTGLVIGLALTGAAALAGWAAFFAQRDSTKHLRAQNALLRRQVEGEERDREQARSATLHSHRGGRSALDYWVEVQNAGPAIAHTVGAALVHRETGEVRASGTHTGLLLPGDKPRIEMRLGEALIRERPPLVLVLTWHDGTGAHEERFQNFEVRF